MRPGRMAGVGRATGIGRVAGVGRVAAVGALVAFGALLGGALGVFGPPPPARADVPPDILDSYTIAISPQSNGLLTMEVTLHGYHAASDWPSSEPYLQIGAPNSSFSITSWSGDGVDVSGVEAVNYGGSFVQFDFSTLPRTGDVFDLHFTITQGSMAYVDAANDQILYNFIPAGWTFPIEVKVLTVTWANPDPASLLESVVPAPTQGDSLMAWRWASPKLSSAGMFADDSIVLAYASNAFDLTDSAIAKSDVGNGGYGDGGSTDNGSVDGGSSGGGSGDSTGFIAFLVGLVVTIAGALFGAASSGDGYGGGSGLHGGIGHLGGGGGGGGGCACAGCACACACACAGGGKVGCSRKAIGIACLPDTIRSLTREARFLRGPEG